MALKENNLNKEPTINAVAIQIVLAISTYLPTIAYRISHVYRIMIKRLIKQPPPLWPHNGPTNPQSHCCEIYWPERYGIVWDIDLSYHTLIRYGILNICILSYLVRYRKFWIQPNASREKVQTMTYSSQPNNKGWQWCSNPHVNHPSIESNSSQRSHQS